ncbi:MAG: tetratricopeptide repeat protein [Alphaproteobacteria bacterium]|nr:tetratricopeptide repeat protein [Alphaproteobacteria bacterium]
MNKIIAVFFSFTLCFSMSSFAGFKEAAELFEQKRYIEAYDEFFICYQQNDLRGNAYLSNIIATDKINAERKEFWTSEELQKLEDTTCIRSEKSLKASILYQDFLKQNNKLLTEKKQNKKKRINIILSGLVGQLLSLHKESISRAAFILINISENDEFRRLFKLSNSSVYYDYALEWHVDRDIYIDAFQKGFLNRKGYETYKLYAQFLIRFPVKGEGELKISNMLKKNASLLNDPTHLTLVNRWLIQAAHLGNQQAVEIVSENLTHLIISKNKISDASYIRDSSILTCLYRAAYDGKDNGYYACLLGCSFDSNHKKNENHISGIQKNNKNSIFWYKKAKEQGHYLGAFNYIVLCCNKYKENISKHTHKLILSDVVEIIDEILKIENDASDLNTKEHKEILSKKIIYFIEIIYIKKFNFDSLLQALNYVIAHAEIESKNIAEYYKAAFGKIDFFEEKLTDDDFFQLYLSASKTCYLAMLELGCIYEHGLSGQEIDFDKSFAYYTNAYNRMNDLGLTNYIMFYNLGMSYLNGRGCEKNYVYAYELLNKAYALAPNDPDIVDAILRCCFLLGETHNKKAYKFAVLAYKMNIPFGDFNYAICLLFGKGCKKDVNQAKEIIKSYYDKNNAFAAYLLGKIELIESSHENVKEYFDNFLLWADPNSDLEQSFVGEVILFLSNKALDEVGVSELAEKKEEEPEEIDDQDDGQDFDIEIIIEEERQKSLDKRNSLKNRQQQVQIAQEENVLPTTIARLKPKQRQIFDAIMDSSVNQEVKWSQFEKLICGLMKNGDFLKPAGGSKINIKLGQVQKQIHMPEHNEAAPLCPGRLKKARELLSAVMLEEPA